jgi:hypothetical protein
VAACAPADVPDGVGFAPVFSTDIAVVGTSPVMAPLDFGNSYSRLVSPGGSHIDSEGTLVFLGGRYSKDDLIAFGGISEAELMVRTSEQIRMQANADDTQLECAMQLSVAKNIGSFIGYSFGYLLDLYVVLSLACGAPPGHGYWVQPFGNGSTGYIQPIRMAVCSASHRLMF